MKIQLDEMNWKSDKWQSCKTDKKIIRTLSIAAAIRVYDENSASLPWALSALQFPKGQAYVEYIPHPQCAVKPHDVKFWNE